MSYIETEKPLSAISWGSVIAGAITVLAVSLLLSLLTSGLGLAQVDAQSGDPLAGVGATFGWTSALALLISLAAGGFLSGYLSGVAGWVHGFMTWALAMLVAAYFSFAAIGGAINVSGALLGGAANVTGSVAGAAGNAVGGAAGLVGGAVSALADTLNGDSITDVDSDDISAQLSRAASQANLDALQPELVQQQLTGARDDVTAAGQDLLATPQNYEAIANDLLSKLRDRVATLETEIDRDAVVQAIADNTDLTEPQVEQAADRAIELYQGVANSAREQLNAIDESVTAAQTRLATLQSEALEQADRAAAAASSAALWAFFGAILGAAVAVGAAIIGARAPVRVRSTSASRF